MNPANETRPLDGLEDALQAATDLVTATRRSLHIYTPNVDPRLYNDPDWLDAIRSLVVGQPKVQIYMLLPPAIEWRRSCSHLVQLAERLSTALLLRCPPPDASLEGPEFNQGFMIADETALVHYADPYRFIGSYRLTPSARGRELLNAFNLMWEKSQPDPELQRLGI